MHDWSLGVDGAAAAGILALLAFIAEGGAVESGLDVALLCASLLGFAVLTARWFVLRSWRDNSALGAASAHVGALAFRRPGQ